MLKIKRQKFGTSPLLLILISLIFRIWCNIEYQNKCWNSNNFLFIQELLIPAKPLNILTMLVTQKEVTINFWNSLGVQWLGLHAVTA